MKRAKVEGKVAAIEDRINFLLNEIRIVVPGTQTLLGFQFASVFTERFKELTYDLRLIHTLSICFVTLAVILLLSTPAYNRIVEKNLASEHFNAFATKMVLAALLALAIGLSLDLYVVMMLGIQSMIIATTIAASAFVLAMGLWFGYSWYSRRKFPQST